MMFSAISTMTPNIPIQELAKQWLQKDHDPRTRKEIQDLIHDHDDVELERRLRKPIAFGTAGLRASMKAGFAHMNSLTVLQASHGLAQYILDQHVPQHAGLGRLSIVIGHDARHNSARFAKLAAGAFIDKGLHVLWYERLVHTPMVPFAVGMYKAAAGVMVTASHNPKQDNGYKVYWSNACQIIPPHDTGIAKCIGEAVLGPSWDWERKDFDQSPSLTSIYAPATNAYRVSLQKLVSAPSPNQPTLSFTYTPMHGVGLTFMEHLTDILQLREGSMHVVKVQADPDPEFPTVPFPNPEERGALDLAMQDADAHSTTIIIANDPDADRFAVAERMQQGNWHQFTGNQMGILLGSHILETYEGDRKTLIMLASTVSSRMLSAMAVKEGFLYQETLTGFKWLGNVAQKLTADGHDAAYAFEEAIGYMFPTTVWDKDGIAAAAVFLTAWQTWTAQGFTPWQKLQQLYQRYGHFEDANTYLISPSPNVTAAVFAAVRTLNDGSPPTYVGPRPILRWRDLTLSLDTKHPHGRPDLPVDPTAQMITCELGDVVFTARGSGTEPKIKLYIEGTAASSADAKANARAVLDDLLREWFRPTVYGLTLAAT